MGKRTNNQIQQQLLQQQTESNRLYQQQITQASQKSPYELAKEQEYLDWTKFMQGGDYRDAPGVLNPDKYTAGLNEREAARVGVGAGQLASGYANVNLIAQQKERGAAERAERTSANYVGAVAAKDASMRGEGMNFWNAQQQKLLNIAGIAAGRADSATQGLINFRPAPSPWWGIAQAAIGGASSVLAARGR